MLLLSPGFNERPLAKYPSKAETQPKGLERVLSMAPAFPSPHVDAAPDFPHVSTSLSPLLSVWVTAVHG